MRPRDSGKTIYCAMVTSSSCPGRTSHRGAVFQGLSVLVSNRSRLMASGRTKRCADGRRGVSAEPNTSARRPHQLRPSCAVGHRCVSRRWLALEQVSSLPGMGSSSQGNLVRPTGYGLPEHCIVWLGFARARGGCRPLPGMSSLNTVLSGSVLLEPGAPGVERWYERRKRGWHVLHGSVDGYRGEWTLCARYPHKRLSCHL